MVLFALLAIVWLKPRKPGVITGCFFAFYGALRIATEQLREPDIGVFTIGPVTLPMLLRAISYRHNTLDSVAEMALAGGQRGPPVPAGDGRQLQGDVGDGPTHGALHPQRTPGIGRGHDRHPVPG